VPGIGVIACRLALLQNRVMAVCHRCRKDVPVEGGKVPRESYCPHCHAALHCCPNCRFHSPHAHNQCSEPVAEWVRDKEKANFCDYFSFRTGGAGEGGDGGASARSAFDDLFKKLP